MKALTLWQPWASLVAVGEKRIETRSWNTNYRGPLAIHAARRKPSIQFWKVDPYLSLLMKHGFPGPDALPLGKVVGYCLLKDVGLITEETLVTAQEYGLGDFRPGRFAWMLSKIYQLKPWAMPKVRGFQRIWNWETDLEEFIADQLGEEILPP